MPQTLVLKLPSRPALRCPHGNHTSLDHVVLHGNESRKFVVGLFEQGIPEPSFCLEFEPAEAREYVSHNLMRVDSDGDYTLTYYFKNFEHRDVRITVRDCETDTLVDGCES